MQKHELTLFQVEQLQPDWLESRLWLLVYYLTSRVVECILFCGIWSWLLLFWLSVRSQFIPTPLLGRPSAFSALYYGGFELGALYGIGVGLIDAVLGRSATLRGWPHALVRFVLYMFLFVGFNFFLIPHLRGLIMGLALGSLFYVSRFNNYKVEVKPVTALSFSWKRAWMRGGPLSLALGLILSALYAAGGGKPGDGGFFEILLIGAMTTLGLALYIFPIVAFFLGLRYKILDLPAAPIGLRLRMRNALVAAFSAVLVFGGFYALLMPLLFWNKPPFLNTALAGFGGGLIAGLIALFAYGGIDVLRHLILRWALSRKGNFPFGLPRFLEYATNDLRLLERAGGGYMFIHRFLLEYFAALDTAGPEPREAAWRQPSQVPGT
jgi:hypothetical protein